MTSWARCPRAYAIVCTYEIVASIHGIITICESSNELSIDSCVGSAVPAHVMSTQGI